MAKLEKKKAQQKGLELTRMEGSAASRSCRIESEFFFGPPRLPPVIQATALVVSVNLQAPPTYTDLHRRPTAAAAKPWGVDLGFQNSHLLPRNP